MENSMEIPQKTKSKGTIWSSNPTPEHISEKMIILKDTFIPMFIGALFTVAKTCQQPKCPCTNEWITKMLYIYIVEYHSFLWKNEIMPFAATWMDLEMVILSAANQTKTNIILYHLYVESKKMVQRYLFIKQTHRHRKQIMVTKGEK